MDNQLAEREYYTVLGRMCPTALLTQADAQKGAVFSISILFFSEWSTIRNALFKYADDITVCTSVSSFSNVLVMHQFFTFIERRSVFIDLGSNTSEF